MPLVARRVDIFPENARTATYDEVAARGGVVNSKVCPQCVPHFTDTRGPGAEMRDTLKLNQKTRLELAMNLRVRKPRKVVQKEVVEITV